MSPSSFVVLVACLAVLSCGSTSHSGTALPQDVGETKGTAACIKSGTVAGIQLEVLAASGACGVACQGKADPHACAATCVMEKNAAITTACAGCFGDLSLCAAEHCLSECVSAPSDACAACGADQCQAPFMACYDLVVGPGPIEGDAGAVDTGEGGDAAAADTTADDSDDDATQPCPTTGYFYDGDGDGVGEAASSPGECPSGPQWVASGGDCDDQDPERAPGKTETCDLVDEDCDGRTDEGCWKAVSAGYWHTCGLLKEGGGVRCWGYDGDGAASWPPGEFVAVSAGRFHNCAAKASGGVVCWGEVYEPAPTTGQFEAISAGSDHHTCALRDDGAAVCWGGGSSEDDDPPFGTFISLASGNEHSCGVLAGGEVECWGFAGNFSTAAPAGIFTEVTAGEHYGCALAKSDGHIECWGSGLGSPAGAFVNIGGGSMHGCAIRDDTSLYCWGYDPGDGRATPPKGTGFVQVSGGGEHSCALDGGGAIVCWGSNDHGERQPAGGL